MTTTVSFWSPWHGCGAGSREACPKFELHSRILSPTESVYLMENVNDSYVSIVTSAAILEHASLCRFHYLHAIYMCFAKGTPSLATR